MRVYVTDGTKEALGKDDLQADFPSKQHFTEQLDGGDADTENVLHKMT